MSYTPTTWTTGDTITASAMNKIEQGIANAGGFAVVALSATGYNSSSHTFGSIGYAKRTNNVWSLISGDSYDVFGYTTPLTNVVPPMNTMVSEDLCPFLFNVNADELVITGNISDTLEPLYYDSGSLVIGGGYRISGSGSIQFVAL